MKTYPAGIYRPRHQRQRLRLGGVLIGCTDTVFAMWADAVTVGSVWLTETMVRNLSSERIPDPASPGLNLRQLGEIARKLHLRFTNMEARSSTWPDVVRHLHANRRVIAQIWYAEIGGGRIGHAILLQTIRASDGRILVNDPMKDAAAWMDADDVRRAMETFGRLSGNGGFLRYALSKPLPYIAVGA